MRKVARNYTRPQIQSVITHLSRARAYIDQGWVKESYHDKVDGHHAYCMLGGITASIKGKKNVTGFDTLRLEEDGDPRLERVLDYTLAGLRRATKKKVVMTRYQKPRDVIESFNDADSRKKEQVLKVIDQAILLAEKDLAER